MLMMMMMRLVLRQLVLERGEEEEELRQYKRASKQLKKREVHPFIGTVGTASGANLH